tara:strand:+ start:6221 stop:6526 length:306 start_codon:yes stop_codon:yes gene_type:complete
LVFHCDYSLTKFIIGKEFVSPHSNFEDCSTINFSYTTTHISILGFLISYLIDRNCKVEATCYPIILAIGVPTNESGFLIDYFLSHPLVTSITTSRYFMEHF